MSNNKSFFESPQAAAVYKHKLIKSYVSVYVGKVGSTAVGGRVYVYDAYSGPGRYENDTPGSPELLVDMAADMARLRDVQTIFSDSEPDYCRQLRELLEDKEIPESSYEVLEGPVDAHLDAVLERIGDQPLFVFLDPFGLTIAFEQIVRLLKARDKPARAPVLQPKTELLMNFSYEAVRRIAGAARSAKVYPAKDGQLEALDRALGGDWWREIAIAQEGGWVSQILEGFASRVARMVGNCGYITADVADSLTAQPVYELILFTRHRDGLWEMVNAMSHARKAWREWLVERRESAAGQTELRGLNFEDDEAAWVSEISENISRFLASNPTFVVQDQLREVFGRTLGLARETHLRKALRTLKDAGVVTDAPKGSLQKAQITRS